MKLVFVCLVLYYCAMNVSTKTAKTCLNDNSRGKSIPYLSKSLGLQSFLLWFCFDEQQHFPALMQ